MKIRRPHPKFHAVKQQFGRVPRMRHSRHVAVFRAHKDGTIVCQAWPKSRKLKKAKKITKQQVVTWDSQLACIKKATGEDTSFCRDLAGKTAFYTRDLLIQAAYGHLVSWPGVGVAPHGVVDTQQVNGKNRMVHVLPHTLGNPQKTNVVTQYTIANDGNLLHVQFHTCLPSNPKVWLLHCDYRKIPRPNSRPSDTREHGKVIFFTCSPIEMTSRSGSGNLWSFSEDSSNGRFDNHDWWAVSGELEDPANFQWHQPPRKVPAGPPRLGYITYAGGSPNFCDYLIIPGVGTGGSFSMGVTYFEGDAVGYNCGPSFPFPRQFKFRCVISIDIAGPPGYSPSGNFRFWLGNGIDHSVITEMPMLLISGYGHYDYEFRYSGSSSSLPPLPEFVVVPLEHLEPFIPDLVVTVNATYEMGDYPP